ENKARADYAANWKTFNDCLRGEEANITLPGEGAAVEEMRELAKRYRRLGDRFYARPPGDPRRVDDYFEGGLEATFHEIKRVSGAILTMNQENMKAGQEAAERTARHSLIGFAAGLAVAVALAVWLAWNTTRATLRPIQAVTRSALAIGKGD